MSKLGFTWYPKDWGNSESVFELSLAERGLYRELIDLAMMNDNNTEIKLDVWSRKFAVTSVELSCHLLKLESLGLIETTERNLFIPSCEARLNLSRGGAKGGKNKPTDKPTPKPIVKPDPKPTPKQREREIESKIEKKEKININDIPVFDEVLVYAKEKEPSVCPRALKMKFESWVENGWKDGNNSKITNWKTKLLNTMPYIAKIPSQNLPTKRRIS